MKRVLVVLSTLDSVAPCVGAWIETKKTCSCIRPPASHPAWVRGLKRRARELVLIAVESHPAWVRGLKPAPASLRLAYFWSHPAWVRGLKHHDVGKGVDVGCVAPCVGAWIETWKVRLMEEIKAVAPCVGAWIETHVRPANRKALRSHPAWVRGLKRYQPRTSSTAI